MLDILGTCQEQSSRLHASDFLHNETEVQDLSERPSHIVRVIRSTKHGNRIHRHRYRFRDVIGKARSDGIGEVRCVYDQPVYQREET